MHPIVHRFFQIFYFFVILFASNVEHDIHTEWVVSCVATFVTNPVIGCLWDSHCMNLGYPSKFYRVQDATPLMVHRFDTKLRQLLWRNTRKSLNSYVFFPRKSWFSWKNSPRQGCSTQKPGLGMHQTHISNRNPSKHQIIGFWRSAAEAATCK